MQVAPTAIGPSAIVSYQVTGLATGRSTEVSITPSVGVVVAQARGCQRLGGGSYSCPITAGETLRLLAVATGRTPGTLTLTVQVPAGTTDPTPGNNSVTVAVG